MTALVSTTHDSKDRTRPPQLLAEADQRVTEILLPTAVPREGLPCRIAIVAGRDGSLIAATECGLIVRSESQARQSAGRGVTVTSKILSCEAFDSAWASRRFCMSRVCTLKRRGLAPFHPHLVTMRPIPS